MVMLVVLFVLAAASCVVVWMWSFVYVVLILLMLLLMCFFVVGWGSVGCDDGVGGVVIDVVASFITDVDGNGGVFVFALLLLPLS